MNSSAVADFLPRSIRGAASGPATAQVRRVRLENFRRTLSCEAWPLVVEAAKRGKRLPKGRESL